MQKISLSDFSGGLQEATGPNDFTARQWSELKGFIPTSEVVLESQWPAQQVGSDGGFQFVVPIPSAAGTFLVGVKASGEADEGTVWWSKAPDPDATYLNSSSTTWTQLTTAENVGVTPSSTSSAAQASINIVPNPDFRFLTYVPLPLYLYAKEPADGSANRFSADTVSTDTPKSIASGALLHSRRLRSETGYTAVDEQKALVVYVDTEYQPTGSGEDQYLYGEVKAVSFPNWRRFPQTNSGSFYTPQTLSGTQTLMSEYPRSGSTTGVPGASQDHHPYTIKDSDGAVLPGNGVIPRANVGVMFKELLMLGNIEWRSDNAQIATQEVGDDTAYMPLSDENSAPHRSSFYFSQGGIDTFDPRAVLRAGTTDTEILGMHVIGDVLVIITSAGGAGDGVIMFEGEFSQLISYSGAPNPFAINKVIIQGGVGGFPRNDTEEGHLAFSTLWSETNSAVFVDRLGGVWYTNGESCDRLDRFGPLPPQSGSVDDHVASVGPHLFVWRDDRLLVFSILGSVSGEGSGVWTEFVPPSTDVKSMYGLGEELYMVCDGNVWRYSAAGPRSERGHLNGVATDLTISTPTLGDPDEQSRKLWNLFGVTWVSQSNGTLKSMTLRNAAARLSDTATVSYTSTLNFEFNDGYHSKTVPAGIGGQQIVSGTMVFQGDVRLQEVSLWIAGGSPKR